MKKILILQFRPEKEVSDDEFRAFLKYGDLLEKDVDRIEVYNKLERINLSNYSALIIGGSPYSVSDKDKKEKQIRIEKELFSLMQEIKKKDFPY